MHLITRFACIILGVSLVTGLYAQHTKPIHTMKIEIWSDVMCPFCYIGKKRFETAFNQATYKDSVEIVWKSFILDPSARYGEFPNYAEFLATKKGMSLATTQNMLKQVTDMAQTVGLPFHFEKAVVANSYNAHRLLHFAYAQGKQDALKEAILKAHFTDGKNIESVDVLTELAVSIGLPEHESRNVLTSGAYSAEVQADLELARQFQIQGVPFFVFNRKYAVSGAQDVAVFKQTLDKAFAEWKKEQPNTPFETIEGPACKPTGECD